jgi:site-specific recombinase XerD
LGQLAAVLPAQLSEITYQQLSDFLRGLDVAKKTRRDYIGAVKCFFEYCARAGLRQGDPALLLPLPRYKRKPPSFQRPEFLNRMIDLAGAPRLKRAQDKWYAVRNVAVLTFIIETGVRASEACAVRRDDVFLDEYFATIKSGKGDSYRHVTFGERTVEALRAHWRLQVSGEYAFENMDGKRMSYGGVYGLVCRISERAGKRITPHQLRHSYASISVLKGVHITHIAAQLGHESIETSMIYCHVELDDRISATRANSPLE